MENLHAGHRDRLRQRFISRGLEDMNDIEALELLLYYALPRRDTNPVAHRLLDRFDGFRGVMEADAVELSRVEGVGESAAMLIRLVAELDRRYSLSDRERSRRLITDTASAGDYVLPLFSHGRQEQAFAVSLGSKGNVIRCHMLANGMGNRVEFSARELVALALRDNAVYILMAHNHLSDTALPSNADVAATAELAQALRYVGVTLLDHIIVCDRDFVSMRDCGFFNSKKE